MSQHYYETRDLQDFPNINEFFSEAGNKFFEYYAVATSAGKLTEREKSADRVGGCRGRARPYSRFRI